MIRKITALCLFFVMLVVTATSKSGLRYCLCLEEIYAGDCNCCLDFVNASTCISEACTSCSQEEEKSLAVNSSSLCDGTDCSVALSFDLGDYFNPSVNYSLSDSSEHRSSLQSPGLVVNPYSKSIRVANGKRGPPIEFTIPEAVPLRIRHSVFLI